LLRDTLALAFVCILAFVAIRRCVTDVPSREDWRGMANAIDAYTAPDDLLVFSNRDPWASSGTWYMGLKYYSSNSRHPWLILNAPADAATLRQFQSHSSVWLIGRHPELQGAELLPGWQPQWETVLQGSAGGAVRMVPIASPPPAPSGHP